MGSVAFHPHVSSLHHSADTTHRRALNRQHRLLRQPLTPEGPTALDSPIARDPPGTLLEGRDDGAQVFTVRGGALAAMLGAVGLTLSSTSAASATDWGTCLKGPDDTQSVFARASRVSGVPEDVLLAVGYLGGRWSHHAGQPSVSGGYGVMHLTDTAVAPVSAPAKGDTNRRAARLVQARCSSPPTDRTVGRAAAQRPGRQHLRGSGRAGVLPAGHDGAGPGRVEQGGRTVRRHRRPPGEPCTTPASCSTCCEPVPPRPPTSATP